MTCTFLLRSAWNLQHNIPGRQYSSLVRTRDAFVRQCLFTLHKQTREPLWRVLAILGHPRVEEAAARAPITETYRRLAVALSSTSTATDGGSYNTPNLAHTLSSLNLPRDQLDALKTWIRIYTLFTHDSHSPSSTLTRIVHPLFESLEDLPTHHQAPLLIFGAAHLSSWNLVLPLERVVEEFVSLPHPIETPVYTSKGGRRSPPPTSEARSQGAEEVETVHQTRAPPRRLLLTLPDTPTRPTSELYFNLFLRALALTPKYSTAYDRHLRRILRRFDTLPRPPVKRPLVNTTTKNSGVEVALVDPNNNALMKEEGEEETVQLPYTIHPDTYTCLLLSTYNALAPPGRVPHQASLLSPPLATYLASRLLDEPGASPSPTSHVHNDRVEQGVMQDVHREALLRFWAKEAKGIGARGVRGQENARELWREIQAKGGRAPIDVQDTLGFGLAPLSRVNEGGKTPKHGSLVVAEGAAGKVKVKELETDPVFRANTLQLGAHPTVRGVRELLTILNSSSPRQSHHQRTGVPATPPGLRPQLKSKPSLDAYDLTSTLLSAANDFRVSIYVFKTTFRKLMKAYKASPSPNATGVDNGKEKAKTTSNGVVPLAAHTAYLRGLYWRGAFGDARGWWEAKVWGKSVWAPTTSSPAKGGRVVEDRYVLDKKAVTIGIQVLARCGQAKEAIEVLETVAWRPNTKGIKPVTPDLAVSPGFFASMPPSRSTSSSVASSTTPTPPPTPPSVPLSPISILDILVAFKRASRPDIVFRLWDHMYTLYGVMPTNEGLNVLLQAARMAVVMEGRSLRAQVRGAINVGRERLRIGGKGAVGQGEGGERKREKAVEDLMDVARKAEYEGGRLWRGKRAEDAAREVFLQCLFGMEVGYGSSVESEGGGKRGRKIGLANVVAPACAVRSDWDSDAGIVGLGVGLPELRLRRFEYKPGREMFAWVSSSASRASASNSSTHPTQLSSEHKQRETTLVPRPLYPSISLTNSNFFSYLSLLAVTRRTTEVALTFAWMRELGINPSESVLALGMVLWEEVSVEGPLVDLVVTKLSARAKHKRNAGNGEENNGENEVEKPEPRDEYERLVFWIRNWVGEERLPGIDTLRKWRGVVRDMREPGVRAALVKQRKVLGDE